MKSVIGLFYLENINLLTNDLLLYNNLQEQYILDLKEIIYIKLYILIIMII